MSEILVGRLVAERYRIVRRLGAGGMGTVYVAVQEPLGREVALKVVRRDLAGDEKAVERFRREAMTLSQTHHPHIVTLHDFGELDDGALYFAMELVPGENLRQRLVRTGPLTVKKALTLVRDTASALAAAHALGIIHRDLKPENILLMEAAGQPDFVKIVDFGVAKLTSEKDTVDQEALTARGSVVGTPGYIAPEVALRGVTTDARSDLYALGVVWFEALAGRAPFRAPTPTALLMAHALDPVPSLPEQVPLPIAGLVQRLLAKNPDDRPETAEELAALIDVLPPFESGASVPRPMAVPIDVEPSALTIEDHHHRASPAKPVPVPASPVAATAISSPAAQAPVAHVVTRATPSKDLSAAEIAASSAPTEKSVPVLSPGAVALSVAPGDRRSMLIAAALIAIAIVVAAVLFTGPHIRVPAVHVDAGVAPSAVVDAGNLALPGVSDAGTAAHDAGVVVHDAGVGSPKLPKPPVKQKPLKKPPKNPDEHAPDIYSP